MTERTRGKFFLVVVMVLLVTLLPAGQTAGEILAGQRIDPTLLATLSDWRFGSIDAEEVIRQVDEGQDVVLDLGFVSPRVRLAYKTILSPDAVAVVGANESAVYTEPPVRPTYAGLTIGPDGEPDPESNVALILEAGNVHGFVKHEGVTYNIQANPGTGLVGQTSAGVIVYRDTDLRPWGIGAVDVDRVLPPGTEFNASQGIETGVGSGTVYVALVADEDYVNNIAGSTSLAFSRMQDDYFIVGQVLSNDFGYILEVTLFHVMPPSEEGVSRDIDDQWEKFKTYMQSQYQNTAAPAWHVAHLFVGHDLTDSVVVYGTAPESAIASRAAIIVTQESNENAGFFAPQSNSNHRKWVHSHELGHILGGRHCLARYTTNTFGFPSTKTIMATWGQGPDATREPDENECADDPRVTYPYNYVDEFSSQSPNNNRDKMESHTTPRIASAPTPGSLSGTATGAVGSSVTLTFNPPVDPGIPCGGLQEYYWYIEIDWGDGTSASTSHAVADAFCNARSLSHIYPASGTFYASVRAKFGYFHPWSAWSAARTVTITDGGGGGVTPTYVPPNGGYGTSFDATSKLGQYLTMVPSGSTITGVCFYVLASTGGVDYEVRAGPNTAAIWSGSVTGSATTEWRCDTQSRSWIASGGLFVYRKEGGTGHVGYKDGVASGTGGAYNCLSGSCAWQSASDRAYGVMATAGNPLPTYSPPNGGYGTSYDATTKLGQYLTMVPTGSTVTGVCFYILASTGGVDYEVRAGPNTAAIWSGSVTGSATTQWRCDTQSRSWTASGGLFVYRKEGAAGQVGYKDGVPSGTGGAYDCLGGSCTWQPASDRAYAVIATGGNPSPTYSPPSGGYGTSYDTTTKLGQYLTMVPSGSTITGVCFYVLASTGGVDYEVRAGPNTAAIWSGSVTGSATTEWRCDTQSRSWTASGGLFVYRKDGAAGQVGYKDGVPSGTGGAYDCLSGSCTWQSASDRAYGVNAGP